MSRSASGSPIAVYPAIGANLVIAVAKFIAAAFTGSSTMIAEGIHSVIDSGNEGLLLLGIWRSRKPPDELHPFGYGKEIYLASIVIGLILARWRSCLCTRAKLSWWPRAPSRRSSAACTQSLSAIRPCCWSVGNGWGAGACCSE